MKHASVSVCWVVGPWRCGCEKAVARWRWRRSVRLDAKPSGKKQKSKQKQWPMLAGVVGGYGKRERNAIMKFVDGFYDRFCSFFSEGCLCL